MPLPRTSIYQAATSTDIALYPMRSLRFSPCCGVNPHSMPPWEAFGLILSLFLSANLFLIRIFLLASTNLPNSYFRRTAAPLVISRYFTAISYYYTLIQQRSLRERRALPAFSSSHPFPQHHEKAVLGGFESPNFS